MDKMWQTIVDRHEAYLRQENWERVAEDRKWLIEEVRQNHKTLLAIQESLNTLIGQRGEDRARIKELEETEQRIEDFEEDLIEYDLNQH